MKSDTGVKLVLDTCVFRDRIFISWLARSRMRNVEVPAVVYMEYRRQLLSNNLDISKLDLTIKNIGGTVGVFDKNAAIRASDFMNRHIDVCPECGKLDWMDTMVAASSGDLNAVIITENTSDFPSVCNLMTPMEAMQYFKNNCSS